MFEQAIEDLWGQVSAVVLCVLFTIAAIRLTIWSDTDRYKQRTT